MLFLYTAIHPSSNSLYYDRFSKDLIIKKVEKITTIKLNHIFRTLKYRLYKNSFNILKKNTNIEIIKIQKKKKVLIYDSYIVEATIANTLWKSRLVTMQRNAIAILIKLLTNYYYRIMNLKFKLWKIYVSDRFYMLIRFFDKWNVKASRMRYIYVGIYIHLYIYISVYVFICFFI
jgi:hypothetical protein